MKNSKVILINGFAGSGKTTIARMCTDNHSLAMLIEGDELIVNIGDWLDNEPQARDFVFELTKKMLDTALSFGHDVVLPYLVVDAKRVAEFEEIAKNHNAHFYEFYLSAPKEHAIERLFKRGVWGEVGVPPITKNDTPIITQLYDEMEKKLPHRPNQTHIQIKEGSPLDTYQRLMSYIDNVATEDTPLL